MSENIIDMVEKAVDVYNGYRAPEAIAELKRVHGSCVEMVFEAHFVIHAASMIGLRL